MVNIIAYYQMYYIKGLSEKCMTRAQASKRAMKPSKLLSLFYLFLFLLVFCENILLHETSLWLKKKFGAHWIKQLHIFN